jgi:hypothetical protein
MPRTQCCRSAACHVREATQRSIGLLGVGDGLPGEDGRSAHSVLKRPQSAIPAPIASGCTPVYPCHVPPRAMRQHPIRTVPFKFVEFNPKLVPSAALRQLRAARHSLFCHTRSAQPDKICRFEQGTDLRHPKRSDGPQTGDTRISIIATQFPGRGKFGRGLSDPACEAIGGGKIGVGKLVFGVGTACLSNQRSASSMQDCSRCTCPLQ